MNKVTPLNANAGLKVCAKNEAKVIATRERLAKSIDFPAYNLRWYSVIFISAKSIVLILLFVNRFYIEKDDERK